MNSIDINGQWILDEGGANLHTKIYIRQKGDTVATLAAIVGLKANEFAQWATPVGEISKSTGLACRYRVPNTVIAYWAGAMGAIGRWWIDWNDNIEAFKNSGYFVAEILSPSENGLSELINAAYAEKSLVGVYYWGHGYISESGYWFLLSHHGDINVADSRSLRRPVPYKLKYGYLYACVTEEIKKIFEPKYGFGWEKTLYPLDPFFDSDWVLPKHDLESEEKR